MAKQTEKLKKRFGFSRKRMSIIKNIVLWGDVVKFVCFNTKEPKVGVVYDVLDDLKKECEIKICKVGEPMVFVTKDSTNITSDVVSVDESFTVKIDILRGVSCDV